MQDDLTLDLDPQASAPRSSTDAPPQDAWGSFRLLARVGSGGFGEVYRAWDPHLEREVALKLLLPNAAGTPHDEAASEDEYQAMLREARALASVRHPNIVPVYGIDRHDGRVGFWTDFVKGRTLSVLLGSQGPFGYREAALIGIDITRALSAVHRAGILHRDIKAENVMREEGGRILLMDFGLCVLPHRQANTAGTPNYMAPELWQVQPATMQTDIYALGVLLYLLVAGEPPVRLGGLSANEAIAALVHRRPLMDLRSDLPESFLRTVSTATETDPARRFATAGQLAASLSECLGSSPDVRQDAGASSAITPPSMPPPVRSWRSSVPVRVAAALLVFGTAAYTNPTLHRWLHLAPRQAASGVSASTYDEYLKAQDLLRRSYKDSNVADAVNGFQQILRQDPNFALAHAGLGATYFVQYRNGNDAKLLDQAKAETNKALSLDTNLAPAYVTLARMAAMAGQPQVALQQVQKAIALDPRSAEAHAAQAETFEALGRLPDAIASAQKAIDLAPENSMWPARLGNYYLSSGNLKDAAAAWQKAIEIDGQNTIAYFDLGIVDMRMDKLSEARQNFQKVLTFGPDADSYRALGTTYVLEGKYAEAAEMDKKALRLEPTNYEGWANLGSAELWIGGKHEEAISAYKKAITLAEEQRKKTPDNDELLAYLAGCYASVGNAEKSLPLARKALALAPDDPNVSYSAGEAYELLGQRSKAIQLVAKALAQGYRLNEFERSPELANLRADPAFSAALEKAKSDSSVGSKNKIN